MMRKQVNRILYLVLVTLIVAMSFGCSKKGVEKKKHKPVWMEKGAPATVPVKPGVHPERGGTMSDAVPIYTLPIYYPLGRDDRAKRKYDIYLYESELKNPEAVDQALKDIKLIDPGSEFCGLEIVNSNEVLNAGPGAVDSQLTKKGKIKYYFVAPAEGVVNTDKYEYGQDQKGMIDEADVYYCITKSFEQTFQLVSCDIVGIDKKTGKELKPEELALMSSYEETEE